MFVSVKWKRWCEEARKEVAIYKQMWGEERNRASKLKKEVQDLEASFKRIHPRMLSEEYIEVSLDLFNKYCKDSSQIGTIDGRPVYQYYPDKSSYWKRVIPTEELPNGYMRYMVKYEEPNKVCVNCNKHFVIVDGYPNKNAQFCDERCFNNHIWKQEMLTKKKQEDHK